MTVLSDRVTSCIETWEELRKLFHVLEIPGCGLQRPKVVTIPNARVVAKPAAVLTHEGTLLWMFSPQLKRTAATCDVRKKRFPQAKRLNGRSLYAAVDGFSYYHWLLGCMPKLLLAQQLERVWQNFDHIIVNSRHKGLKNFQTESLNWLSIPAEKLIWLDRGQHFQCDELVLLSETCLEDQTLLLDWAFTLLRNQFLPWAQEEILSQREPRFYISRAMARRRKLQNESDLAKQLTARGIHTIYLEEMPLRMQVACFANANEIIALHGAGLANLVFCKANTQVVEILPDTCPNPCFANLARQAGLSYTAFPAQGLNPELGFASDVSFDIHKLKV